MLTKDDIATFTSGDLCVESAVRIGKILIDLSNIRIMTIKSCVAGDSPCLL